MSRDKTTPEPDLEMAFADQWRLAVALNRDVVTLQKSMMTIWHLAGDDIKKEIELAMAATGMPRLAP